MDYSAEIVVSVWRKLQEQNPEFFYFYNYLQRVRYQVLTFAHLNELEETRREKKRQRRALGLA